MSEAKAFVLDHDCVCKATPAINGRPVTSAPHVTIFAHTHIAVYGVDALIELIRACEYALEAKHTLYTADDVKRFYELNGNQPITNKGFATLTGSLDHRVGFTHSVKKETH